MFHWRFLKTKMDSKDFMDNVHAFFMAIGLFVVLLPLMIGKLVKFLIE